MDETRKRALEEELAEATRVRDEADGAIAWLSKRLGVPYRTPGAPGIQDESEVGATPPSPSLGPASPAVLVREGEFWGMSAPKGARALLEKSGRSRPLKTRELLLCLQKGGVQLGGKNPEGTLYRSLSRDSAFKRVGRGVWGLSAWYPKQAKVPAKGEQEADAAPEGKPVPVQDDESETEEMDQEEEDDRDIDPDDVPF